jgi:predicted DNA-binding transcriptional regulator YafY
VSAPIISASLGCLIQENHSLNLEKHGVDGEFWHRDERLSRQLGPEHPRHGLGQQPQLRHISDLADAGLAKIERTLPADKVRDLRRLLDCLYVGQLSPKQDISDLGAIDPALLPAFETAFLQRLHLRFHYRDAKGAETIRDAEPQALLILPPLWYLVAWDAAREDFRHFRMDRISKPEILEGTQFRRRHVPFEDDVCPFRELR